MLFCMQSDLGMYKLRSLGNVSMPGIINLSEPELDNQIGVIGRIAALCPLSELLRIPDWMV